MICGGESGAGARPMLKSWATSIRDQCDAAGVAYFHKQNGEWIEADEWLGMSIAEYYSYGRLLTAPLNYSDAEVVAELFGGVYQHFSDGATMIRVGKKRAGRRLDGRTHDDYPRETTV